MGGKNKTSQRTKNNTRPSSSGRSAELLSNVPTSFIGFSSVGLDTKPMPLAFPLSLDSPGNDVGTEFQLVIKKLNKKDPTTKTKALQEMSELVKEKTTEEVTAILPYWARLYRLLTNDTEHRVRECTQSTHGVIVSKCGREIAPYLKQIIPTWLTAQYDNYAPAASNAQNSMQAAFPELKLPDVITFCKKEVMEHITTNLISDNQASFSNTKSLEPEIVEMRHQRITMGTLQGFNVFTKHLPDKHSEWLWTEQQEILQSNKFWKLSSDKCSHVRSAWFGVISRQIERFPELFGEKFGPKATKILMNNLMEKDPLVAMQLWECFLLLTATVKEWYSWVEKKEQLSNRILDLLENGGWGNPTNLASIILPLLANLPSNMLTKEFYSQFFVAIINGLNKKATLASKTHRQAYLTAIGECLKYVSIYQIDTFAVEIVTSALRTWLEKILESPYESQTRTNIIKYSAIVMISLIKVWLKKINEGNEKYNILVRNFWQNKRSTIVHQIEKLSTDSELIKRSIDGHILLLQTLNVSFEHDAKKKATIKFEDENTSENFDNKDEIIDIKMSEIYKHNLNQLVYTTCAQYMVVADQKKISQPIFVPLYTLLEEFNSQELFSVIQKNFSIKGDSLYGLYEEVLKKWMTSDTMRCKEIVHIIFLLVPHLNSDEQKILFKSFNQAIPAVVEEIISKGLSHPYSSYDYVRDWMKSDVVDETLASLCRRFVNNGDSHSRNMILMSFSQDRNGNIIISERACSAILSILTEALRDIESVYLDVCASLASQLVTVLLTEDKSVAYKDLLLEMLKLNALVESNDENFSEDTWHEVKTSWQDGLSALEEEDRKEFFEKAIHFLQNKFLANLEEIDIRNVNDVIELATSLMSKFNENNEPEDCIQEVTEIASALIQNDIENSVEMHALFYDFLTGTMNFFCGNNKEITNKIVNISENEESIILENNMFISYVYKCLLRAKFINVIVFGPEKMIEDENVEEEIDDVLAWSKKILGYDLIEDMYLNALHDYSVLKSIDRAYSFWENHSMISKNLEVIAKQIKDVANQMSPENESHYLISLSRKASMNGFYWNEAFNHFREITNQITSQISSPLKSNCLLAYRKNYGMDRCYFAHSNLAAESSRESDLKIKDDFDLINESWMKLVTLACGLDRLTLVVNKDGIRSEEEWDGATLTMCSYIQAVDNAKVWWSAPKVVLMAHSSLKLFSALERFINSIKNKPPQSRSANEKAQLDEWQDVISLEVVEHVYRIVLALLEKSSNIELGLNHTIFLTSLSEVVKELDWSRLTSEAKCELPLSRILKVCLKTFTVTECQYQIKYLSYFVLKGLRTSLQKDDTEKYNAYQKILQTEKESELGEERQKPKYSVNMCVKTFAPLGHVANDQLSIIKLGESNYTLSPFTEIHSVVLSYLLLVEFTLDYSNNYTSLQLQQDLLEIFSNGNTIAQVMANSIKLLPAAILNNARSDTPQMSLATHFTNMFINSFHLTVSEAPLGQHIEALACRCLLLTLEGVGSVSARGWYGTVGSRLTKTIDNLVSTHITPVIVKRQHELVHQGINTIPLVTVKSIQSSYEFYAEYVMDEKKMELQIKMSQNHPLTVPSVKSIQTPFNNSQFLTKFLAYQNGTVIEAIRIWVNMLSKDVDSVQPCYICYNRLHAEDGKLPDKFCTSCRNHYHKHCVFQWFKQSYKASCPICRNPF